MVASRIIAGVVRSDGWVISGGADFKATRVNTGEYQIHFRNEFSDVPAVVGSQVLYQNDGQGTSGNVVFPFLNTLGFTALTGNGGGDHEDRSFAFIAAGN